MLRSLRCGLALLCALAADVRADIRTDGALGPAVTLPGPNFRINEALGRLSGSNLFHSFAVFDINAGQSATFVTTTPGLANVISRVTGGSASQINGLLRLQSANAAPNFFFINPAGVTFGGGASIDVPAAFHVSTANYLKFPDGNFYADPKAVSTLSAAAPEAFGFLGTRRANINIRDGARLAAVGSNPISITAGDITVDNGKVMAEGGDIRVAAVAQAPSEVGLRGPLPAAQGTLQIRRGGELFTEAQASGNGGSISASAGEIVINGANSGITTMTDYGRNGTAGSIELAASGTLFMSDGGSIVSYTASDRDTGTIRIRAGNFVIDGGPSGQGTGVANQVTSGKGNVASTVITVAGDLDLRRGGQITSSTSAEGRAGTVQVTAERIHIEGTGITTEEGEPPTGILSQANRESRGDAGSIEIVAATGIVIENAGAISTSTLSSGNAGSIKINAGAMAIRTDGIVVSDAVASSGAAGSIDVSVTGALSLETGGQISSSTSSTRNAGSVNVHGGSIVIDGQNGNTVTGILTNTASAASAGNIIVTAADKIDVSHTGIISSSTLGSGSAGNVQVSTAGDLTVRSAALITSSSFVSNLPATDLGRAGNVEVRAGAVVVDGAGSNISAVSSRGSSGQTGNVDVIATGGVTLSNGGFLSIQNFATVVNPNNLRPTTLRVSAPVVALNDGQITAASSGNVSASNVDISFGSQLLITNGAISTSAQDGNGGSIAARGTGMLVLQNGQITTSVAGQKGNGGDITIASPMMVMQTGFVQANTAAPTATGGNVNISVDALLPSGGTLFVGGATPYSFTPDVFGFNVIQAAAPDGVSGTIAISTPALDIAGSLSTLPAKFFDAGGPARSPCAVVGGSSLSQVGRGGLPPSAGSLLRTDAVLGDAAPTAAPSGVNATVSDLDFLAGYRYRRIGAPCYM